MLQDIRDRAQGWFAAIIFGFIAVAFAFWGINFYIRSGDEIVVAKVNGDELKLAQFERGYQDYRRRLQSLAGKKVDLNQVDQNLIKQQALQQIIEDQLLKQTTKSTGLRVGDRQVAAAIQSFEPFQSDGRFARELYENRLRTMGLSPVGFEERMRGDMLTEQLRQGIADTNFTTRAEVDAIERLKGQKRDLLYGTIAAEPYKAGVKPADTEIDEYFKKHSDRYMTPELVKIVYLELSAEALAKTVSVDDDALKDYYEQHKAEYSTPEQRSANHILVQVAKDAKPGEVEAARKKAEEYLAEAKSGKSFEDIALAHSDDVGSKGEGGKTGFFKRGDMVKEFEEAAFSMQPGEIRGPIHTPFGFHVIRLNEVKPQTVRSLDEARADVEKAYRQAQAEKLYYEKADQLSNLTYENSDSLEPAARALGLTVKEADYFPRSGGQDLLADPKILDVAFSQEVMTEGLNSQPIELSQTHSVVLRVADHKAAAVRELAAVRSEVIDGIIADTAREKAAERGRALVERLNRGESRETISQSEQIKWTEVKDATRSDPNVNRAVVRSAFKLRPAKDGAAVYGGVPLGTGDYGIVGVLAVHDADPAGAEEKDRAQTQQELLKALAEDDWKDFVAALRSRATIKTYLDKL